ncbi:DUF3987 domain-containing protein [Sabulilitoribacter multivorans]|uniref:DUF3987 domain-containing protein n=1 Tax=Flaviramulus multivorans TaxID=1304750 RepID=A0ABS9IF96_9FLAO|nr:DUF3987 domain-containing protein [Flaviramulus multivorans]MCF7559424.1 DUF3987 domain-containing protein [Flaviramulus multivorans]
MQDKVKDMTSEIANKNLFPVHVLPATFRNLVKGLNESLKFPIDYTGTAILVAIATAIGTTAKVKVKDKWYEFASLFTCIIGNAGANKTHPISTVFKALKAIDKETHDVFVKKYKEYETYQKTPARERQIMVPVPEPILTKLILSNYTPEALSKRLNDNPRGCTVLTDELASFFEGMNNYSKADNSSYYLSFWSNQATTIDRVSKPVPLLINTPFLSIIGGLQPRMLSKVFHSRKLDSGFFQRFLFAFPQEMKKEPINDNVLDAKIYEEYSNFITNYIKDTTGKTKTRELGWTKGAKDYFYDWQTKNCVLVNENQDTIKGEIIAKFDNHFIRLSLILQMMEDPESTEIGISAVRGANALCKYYLNCAFKVLAKIQNPLNHLNQLPDNKKHFYNELPDKFTTAEAIELGETFDFQERRLKTFLNDHLLFRKIKHGNYEKKIKS